MFFVQGTTFIFIVRLLLLFENVSRSWVPVLIFPCFMLKWPFLAPNFLIKTSWAGLGRNFFHMNELRLQ